MVDLREEGLSRRDAAKRAATVLAKDGLRWETLRLHYREQESAGTLPAPSSHIEHKQESLRRAIRERAAAIEEARRALAAAEEKAKALGLDLSGDLVSKRMSLVSKRRDLQDFLNDMPDVHMYRFRREGITGEEESARRLAELEQESLLLERQIESLAEVDRLRALAGQEF